MMKKILIICLLGLCSCSSDSTEEVNTGGIAGSVSDQNTGDPVATVNVTLSPGGKSTVTGSDGSFSFVDLEPDDYTIDIRKEGYNPNSSRIRITAGQQAQAHLLIERIPAIVTADREELDFGENVGVNTLSFGIVNSSYEDLSWQIEHNCRWIKEIRPASGVLKLGKTETIVVIIDRELLPVGNNETVLVVRSTNGRAEVKIKAVGAERDTPRLNILDATEITSSAATLNGEILAAGIPVYTERGFVYSLNSMPTFDNMLAKLTAPVTEDNTYSYNLRGLILGETYYVRAYATNSVGTAYSANEIDFTTIASSPELTVQEVTDMNASKASVTFNGVVVNVGDPAYFECGFVYSTDSNPTINNTKIKANGTSEGAFSANISGLQLNQRYYVRTYATSKIGETEQTVYSFGQVHFALLSTEPAVSVQDVTNMNVSAGTATFNGAVTNVGTPAYIERGFVYGLVSNPTVDDTKVKTTGTGTGAFSANISGLKLGQQYFVRAYAIYEIESTAYRVYSSEQVTFTLIPTAPSVSVQNVTNLNVSGGTATFNGTITNVGTPIYTERGFVYGTTRNPTVDDKKIISSGSGIGAFSVNVSDFDLNKTYYVRAYVVCPIGIIYSQSDVNFILTSSSPRLSVQIVSSLSVEKKSVTLNGAIESVGTPPYSERGFVYSTTTNPTLNDTTVPVPGTEIGSFSTVIHDLQLEQTYYVRAYANSMIGNVAQTVYSDNQTSFTYKPTLPSVKIDAANPESYASGSARFSGTICSIGDPTYTEKGFVYGLNSNPLISDTKIIVDGNNSGSFTTAVTSLATDKRYYVRAYAINDAGVAYSDNMSFLITATIPSIMNMSNTVDKAHKTAILKATVSGLADPPVKELGFVYSNMTSNPTLADNHVRIEGPTNGDISTIIAVDIDKTYCWRVYIVTDAGTSYYSTTSFSTSTTYPSIITLAASNENAASGSATLNGNITNIGDPAYTEKGFVYSASNTLPTVNDSKIAVDGLMTGKYSYALSGLQPNTFYYVRAYAANIKGVVYGSSIRILGPGYYTYTNIGLNVQASDGGMVTYAVATTSCKNSRVGGYSDWRLPTLEECSRIYAQKSEFDNYTSNWLWTSTYAGEDYYGLSEIKAKFNYICSFYNGANSWSAISPFEDNASYRCVRTH